MKPYKCSQCTDSFSDKHELKLHMGVAHEETKHCTKCDIIFVTKANLKRHIAVVHEKLKTFKCNHCDAKFASNGNF